MGENNTPTALKGCGVKMNIQQYVYPEKTVKILRRISNAFQYGGQREKDELPNDTAMEHTKPWTRPNSNLHFSFWSLAGVLWPPELAFSPTW